MVTKVAGVLPLARRYAPDGAMYTTLMMSTGLTFGTISSLYGLQTGLLDRTQFSLLVTTVIASAVLPTFIAQRWFDPRRRGAADEQAQRAYLMAPAEEGVGSIADRVVDYAPCMVLVVGREVHRSGDAAA